MKYLFGQIKQYMFSINLMSQQIKNVNKKWVYQFHIGRTVTRFCKDYINCENNKWNSKLQVNMIEVIDRKLPKWKKDLYSLSHRLIYNIDKEWTGELHDFVVHFSCMDKNSFVYLHEDNDVSSQFILTFGQYTGGKFKLFDKKSKKFQIVDTYNKIVQIDGRLKHCVTKVKSGKRYSVIFYKMFDRRYKNKPIFNGIKSYDLR